jgi:hypothetical protein
VKVAQSPTRRRVVRAALVAIAVAAVGGAGFGIATAFTGPSREDLVAERSAEVMPFDLAATTHHFEPTPEGGRQTVVADDPGDRGQITLIQQHLRAEAAALDRGEFGDPAQIHGSDMPGLAALESNPDELAVSFHPRADGAELRYATDDPVVLDALHDWFAAQSSDHQGHAG